VSKVVAQGAAFDFQQLFAAAFAVVGLVAATQADQVLGQRQVQRRGEVDRERPEVEGSVPHYPCSFVCNPRCGGYSSRRADLPAHPGGCIDAGV